MVDITILIPVKNEENNIKFCLEPIYKWASKILIVDSQSTDNTCEIANQYNAEVVQFYYNGGWPKKRQYFLDNYNFKTSWILLLDSDEILTEKSKNEIESIIKNPDIDGCYLFFKMEFFGKMLNYSDPGLRKLSLFRKGKGRYERRLENQDESMADMEIHEHVIVKGNTINLKSPIIHRNFNSISRFIIKHDEYSNYEANVHVSGTDKELKANFWGNREQRRRYLKKRLITNPFSPFLYFIYMYILRAGFIDGKAGFFYILYQSIYMYFVSSKMYEIKTNKKKTIQ